ncbi:STAS domain-containing protein [Mycobacterium sp.]|uniref:STAS domain-containing protein n=1 Tax=Mycobacterium sp. TaxID=1785 RepID=UPI002D68B4ED|nr:STAS domain-containing protein [Mycobacterium sp.]HZA12014.1 STAS domain-containing protein [Mycobacterium sp.]
MRLSTRDDNTATVVAAIGEIDASNIDRLTEYVGRAVSGNRPLVLDLSGLSFFGAQGIPALFLVSEQCGKAGIDWAVVVSRPVMRLLRIGDKDHRLPTVGSVSEALKRVTTPRPTRRLLQLVTKSG